MAPRSAAQSLYPHLPSTEREPVKQSKRTVADAMWPQLSREAKARDHDQRLWDEILQRQRDALVRGLRETVASIRSERGR